MFSVWIPTHPRSNRSIREHSNGLLPINLYSRGRGVPIYREDLGHSIQVMTDNELLTQASAQNRLTASIGVTTTDPNSPDDPLWTMPDFQWLQTPTVEELRNICDWTHPRPLGIWTWLDRNAVDPNYSLLEIDYSTGNGPRLSLEPIFTTTRRHRLEYSIIQQTG